MSERSGPQVYAIAAHRGFADALVAGLIPRYSDGDLGLARLTLLLPSQRAARTVTEAFVRASKGGMLLPRMAVVGDLDLDETLGSLLDPLGAGADIPPAADPTRRWLRLAELLREEGGEGAPSGPALLRQAFNTGRTIDRLLVEEIAPEELLGDRVLGIVGDLQHHWVTSLRLFARVQLRWREECAARGEIDAPERRNRLFDHAARTWRARPPAHPLVAAGVTSASPALARLLRTVSELPRGAVILPDLDLALDSEIWDELGSAGVGASEDDPPIGAGDAVTHPQYHLKLLLNRMGIARDEVQPWHRAGLSPAPPARSRAISNLFLPPKASARWIDLPADQRRLAGVRVMETAHPGEEAQAIAILIREALTVPEKRVALITPDRGLAARVVAHLARWNIVADDTAGAPLPQTAAGRVILLLAEVVSQRAAPVPLLALLGHPLVRAGEGRAAWLEQVRTLDVVLRGPRKEPGLAALRRIVNAPQGRTQKRPPDPAFTAWWDEVEALLAPLLDMAAPIGLGDALGALAQAAEALCGGELWGRADGRALAGAIEDLRAAAGAVDTALDPRDLAVVLRDTFERTAVRPLWGSHPRVAIYGLIEARMSRADLVICGALHEGSWPASPAPDALLAPPVLRALGVPGADFRIGLSAHDLAAALGAPEVVLSHARRDVAGPVIPSRFVLRVRALAGRDAAEETAAVALARSIDAAEPAKPYPRPQPRPTAAQRDVAIAATALDRLRGDPYQFYAQAILRLSSPDALDAEPSAAWKGNAAHTILERWHKEKGALLPLAEAELDAMSAHPLMRGLWRPRLLAALTWVEAEIAKLAGEGRAVLVSEAQGSITVDGVRVHGRADRVDRLADGRLAVVDYKTGAPPSGRMVEQGFALQLGLIGLIAQGGGFAGVSGDPAAFEYWSLAKHKDAFGYRAEPIKEGRKTSGLGRDEFLDVTRDFLREAIARWIVGDDPFTARLNPDLPGYGDYDQLMRLDEWQGRGDPAADAA